MTYLSLKGSNSLGPFHSLVSLGKDGSGSHHPFLLSNPFSTSLSHRATHLGPLSAVDAPEKIEQFGAQISSLTLEDARILVDYLQDKLGISAAAFAPAAVLVAPGAGGAEAPATVEEKMEFDVVIDDVTRNASIAVIKV